MNTEIKLNVNDYLDLYLFAKKIDDTLWQHEIIEKLRDFSTERSIKRSTIRQRCPLEKIQNNKRRNLYSLSGITKSIYK